MSDPSNAHRPDADHERQAERRRAARLVIAETIATAASLQPAVSGILQAVCEALAWDVGVFWMLERGLTAEAGVLRCREFWKRPGISVTPFESMTVCHEFSKGQGLPGRVW